MPDTTPTTDSTPPVADDWLIVTEALEAAGWTGADDNPLEILEKDGAVWAIANDCADSGLSKDGWTVEFPSDTPVSVVVAACLAAVDRDPARQVLGTTDQQPETAPTAPVEPCTEHPNCYTRAWDRPELIDRATEFELRGDTEIRAAAFREAADFVGNDDDCGCGGCDSCVSNKLAAGLRRMADEAQQPETEAHPTQTEWIGEVLELDGTWEYLGASPDRGVTESRRASITRRHPDAQTRTVRKTTTYTVAQDES